MRMTVVTSLSGDLVMVNLHYVERIIAAKDHEGNPVTVLYMVSGAIVETTQPFQSFDNAFGSRVG
jgi:uncharacterized protein YlzI (FlbEa/FlbD family)